MEGGGELWQAALGAWRPCILYCEPLKTPRRECVPVDVLSRLFLWFSQAKHFKCHYIYPPQEVQCGLGCTSHLYQSLFDRKWVGAR